MLDNASEGTGERRIGPSVSRDKWLSHARSKLQRGYVLIVGKGKRTANFYSRDKGYEMCAFEVARALVSSGEIVASGDHHLGTVYTLTPTSAEATPVRPVSTTTLAPAEEAEDLGLDEEETEEAYGDEEAEEAEEEEEDADAEED